MTETFCGKSCEGCQYREELNCPGCAAGPGKRHSGDCSLARCCIDKGHVTCQTCQLSGHCGVLRGRDRAPEDRIKRLEKERKWQETLEMRAPILGKWLWILFWLVIPTNIASLMTSDVICDMLPGLYMPGTILQALAQLAAGVILLRLSKMDRAYGTAGKCFLIGSGVVAILNLILGGQREKWTLLITVPAAILVVVGKYYEFHAHSNILQGVDSVLAQKWHVLWKWYIGLYAALFGSLLLTVISPLLVLLVMLAVLVGMTVVWVVEMVYLYRTAKEFREYVSWQK